MSRFCISFFIATTLFVEVAYGDSLTIETELAPTSLQSGDGFGVMGGVSNNRIVVSANQSDAQGVDAGAAYVFEKISSGNWSAGVQLLSLDGAAGDLFGSDARIDGDVVLVGANNDDDLGSKSGSAYVFRFDSTTASWIQEQKLLASNGVANDEFGSAVDIENDLIVVGAQRTSNNRGAIYVFRYDGSQWVEEQIIEPADTVSGDLFGHVVSISGNRIAASAFNRRVYVFRFDGSVWVQEARLDGPAGTDFGQDVSLDQDRLVVGARDDDELGTDSGAAYVYELTGSAWTLQTKLVASDGSSGDFFGESAQLDGDRLLVGAEGSNGVATNSGAAYLFEFDGTGWEEVMKLEASNGVSGDRFGETAVRLDGDTLLVGARTRAGTGAAYVFELANLTPSARLVLKKLANNTIRGIIQANVGGLNSTSTLSANISYNDGIETHVRSCTVDSNSPEDIQRIPGEDRLRCFYDTVEGTAVFRYRRSSIAEAINQTADVTVTVNGVEVFSSALSGTFE